jgi:hypothetical protein
MAFIPIPFGIRTVLRGHAVEGQELIHAMHVKAPTATPSQADCVAVNNVFIFWFANQYRNMVNTGVMCDDVTSTSLASSPAPQAQAVSGVLGVRPGIMTTANLTLRIKSQTGNSGRTNRGGSAPWPFVTLDLLLPGNNRTTSTYRAALTAVFNNLVGLLNTAGYPLCVLSYADQALKPITNYVAVDDYLDESSRRLLGHGR